MAVLFLIPRDKELKVKCREIKVRKKEKNFICWMAYFFFLYCQVFSLSTSFFAIDSREFHLLLILETFLPSDLYFYIIYFQKSSLLNPSLCQLCFIRTFNLPWEFWIQRFWTSLKFSKPRIEPAESLLKISARLAKYFHGLRKQITRVFSMTHKVCKCCF